MRLFLAFPVGDAARQAATAMIEDLRRGLTARSVKWVERENLHVTLRFLGEVGEERIPAVRSLLTPPLTVPGFPLELGAAGYFPATGPPRVIWVGVAQGADRARSAFAELEKRLGSGGLPSEARPYTPHLTLGRARELSRDDGRRLRERLARAAAPPATSWVDRVTLYRSHLGPGGSRYEVLMETSLGDPDGAP